MQYINYLQEGGAAGAATQAVVNTLPYMIPVYGSYLSIKDAVEDPSWSNIANAGVSTVGDLLTIFGIGAGIKALATASKGAKAVSAATKAVTAADKAATEASKTLTKATKAYTRAKQASESVNLLPEASLTKQLDFTRKANDAREAWKAAQFNYADALGNLQVKQDEIGALRYFYPPVSPSDKLGLGTIIGAGTLIKPYARELSNR